MTIAPDPTDELRPTPLEIATGHALGHHAAAGPLPPAPPGTTLRVALEDLLAQALARPPCGVSFSGGRDSSAVLAIATRVARREGLPLPVPVTLVFPDDPESDEHAYQQMVINHLGLTRWERLTYHDELDLVGPIAAPLLRRYGVTVPFNVYFHQPMFEALRGGSLLTGIGGDELFSAGLFHGVNLSLTGRRRPQLFDPLLLLLSVAPLPLRRPGVRRWLRDDLEPPGWLRPGAAREVAAAWLEEYAGSQLSFRRSVHRELWPERARVIGLAALDRLAAEEDVRCRSPFLEPSVLAAVAATQGFRDFRSRSVAMQALVGDVLPPELPARTTKAIFPSAFFGPHARAFAAEWDGTCLPDALAELVDVPALLRVWRADDAHADMATFALLQSAWLATRSGQDSSPTSSS